MDEKLQRKSLLPVAAVVITLTGEDMMRIEDVAQPNAASGLRYAEEMMQFVGV